MVVEIDQPGAERPVRLLGVPVKLSRTPGRHDRLPGPALGEHTEEVLLGAGFSADEVAEMLAEGDAAGAALGASEAGRPATSSRA
jgi:crotonobetainyl-CoA:carnitine CoA-transferase CaiB-like acyl-CoA transferase